ncbi:MAG TPA: hypothetical protein PLQ00_14160 [Thermoguttaceae bacterium]|nr:hypothetical protein [Thermoguttaceae bacterium]
MIDQAILLLVSGLSAEAAANALQSKLGVSAAQAIAAAKEAEKKIILAANYDRTKELGTAISRLNDLYRRAVAIQDTKTALQIQRELNKLLDLYDHPMAAEMEHVDTESLSRSYLQGLGLGDADTPLPELCRRAAMKLIEYETQKQKDGLPQS